MLNNREDINTLLWNHYREFRGAESYFGVDNNQHTSEMFDKAKLRILVCFMSEQRTKWQSLTFSVLQNLVTKDVPHGDVFIDHAYFPEYDDLALHNKYGLPLWFGNVSHAPISDYDIIFISHAVFGETLNVPFAYQKTGIPFSIDDRLDNPDIPLILLGGPSAHSTFVLHSEFAGGRYFVDGAYYGYVEGIIGEAVYEMTMMSDRAGFVRQHKRDVIDYLSQESVSKRYFFNPRTYKFHHQKDKPLLIDWVEKADKTTPYSVEFGRNSEIVSDSPKVFTLSGYNSTDYSLLISKGCNTNSCTFCLAGVVGGPFREAPFEDLQAALKSVKVSSAPNTVSLVSYNPNHYSRFFDLTLEVAKHAKTFGFSTIRTDVLAESADYMRLANILGGTVHLTLAVEGMSERLRLQMLNKGLTNKQLLTACRNAFAHRMIQLKFSIIITGYEEQEDIDEWINLLEQICEMRNSTGSRAQIIISHNPLVMFNSTPLRWMARKTAEQCYGNDRGLTDYIAKLFDMGLIAKFSNRGPAPFLEQLFSDCGTALGDFLINLSLKQGLLFDHKLSVFNWPQVRKAIEETGLDPTDAFAAKDVHCVCDVDVLGFTPNHLFQSWKTRHQQGDFTRNPCLRTPANKTPSCSSCGYCSTKDEVKALTERSLENVNNFDTIARELATSKHSYTTRVVANLSDRWDFVDKGMLSHIITARILQHAPELADSFFSVGMNSLHWVSSIHQRGWYSGKFVFDILWRSRISLSRIHQVVQDVSDSLETTEILGVYEIENSRILTARSKAGLSYFGTVTGLTIPILQESLANYDGNVLVASRALGFGLDTKFSPLPDLQNRIKVVSYKGSLLMYMTLPQKVNPYLVLHVLGYKTPAKFDFPKAQQNSRFTVVDHFENNPAIRCRCGRGTLGYSLVTNSLNTKCVLCSGEQVLAHMMGI